MCDLCRHRRRSIMLTADTHNCDNKKYRKKRKKMAGGVPRKCNEFDLLFLNKSNIFEMVLLPFPFCHDTSDGCDNNFFLLSLWNFPRPLCPFLFYTSSSSSCSSLGPSYIIVYSISKMVKIVTFLSGHYNTQFGYGWTGHARSISDDLTDLLR